MSTAQRVGRWCAYLSLLGATLLSGGCAALRPTNDPPKAVLSQSWSEIGRNPRTLETNKITIDSLAAQFSANAPPTQAPNRPLQILSVSAGGQYAAYTAGLLEGWTVHGTRPNFDIVTGVSSGAIVAVFAFLGPQYDAKLKQFFTVTDQKDLFPIRPLRNLAFHGSLAYPHGLNRIIEEELNATTLQEICAAHRAGRRLFLATMNVQTKRMVVWDVGGIASSGRPDALDLVRKIVLAATAVPGLLPPVEFDITVDGKRYTEQHCDGGPVSQGIVRFGPDIVPVPGTKWLAGSQLYCLAAGKIEPDPLEGRRLIGRRIAACISASLYTIYKLELLNHYALCQATGMQFNLAYIPQDTVVHEVSTRIVAAQMRPLYEMGFQMAVKGPVWRSTPPGAIPGEEPQPRSGLDFRTCPEGEK